MADNGVFIVFEVYPWVVAQFTTSGSIPETGEKIIIDKETYLIQSREWSVQSIKDGLTVVYKLHKLPSENDEPINPDFICGSDFHDHVGMHSVLSCGSDKLLNGTPADQKALREYRQIHGRYGDK